MPGRSWQMLVLHTLSCMARTSTWTMAAWSPGGQLDWWVKERREWWGRVRGADGRQRWVRAVDLRPASDSHSKGKSDCSDAASHHLWLSVHPARPLLTTSQ
jgi:hypothetical protein